MKRNLVIKSGEVDYFVRIRSNDDHNFVLRMSWIIILSEMKMVKLIAFKNGKYNNEKEVVKNN